MCMLGYWVPIPQMSTVGPRVPTLLRGALAPSDQMASLQCHQCAHELTGIWMMMETAPGTVTTSCISSIPDILRTYLHILIHANNATSTSRIRIVRGRKAVGEAMATRTDGGANCCLVFAFVLCLVVRRQGVSSSNATSRSANA
jgi:hypothetical protein